MSIQKPIIIFVNLPLLDTNWLVIIYVNIASASASTPPRFTEENTAIQMMIVQHIFPIFEG